MAVISGNGCSPETMPKAGVFELQDSTLMVRGVAVRIKENSLLIRYSRYETIRLETSRNMVLHGFPSLWAIEADQPVRIKYRVKGDRNIIISITRIPRLGC